MKHEFSLGLDFGTNSVRALILDVTDGEEIASEVAAYPGGEKGILLDETNPHLARQHPGDYLTSMEQAIRAVLKSAVAHGVEP